MIRSVKIGIPSVLILRDPAEVIHFHEIKNNPEYFISLYKKKYGGEYKTITNLKDEVFNSISRDMKPGNELKSSRPNKEKDDLKYLYKTNVESNILASFSKIIHSKF